MRTWKISGAALARPLSIQRVSLYDSSMADAPAPSNLFADMFKAFPIASVIFCLIGVYVIWRSTGGIERGEERRALGQESVFVEVLGVPEAYENQEFFSAFKQETVQGIADDK